MPRKIKKPTKNKMPIKKVSTKLKSAPAVLETAPTVIAQQPLIIQPFSALQNLQLITPSENSQFFLVDRHFACQLLEKLIARVYVNEHWYLNKYPDTARALAQGPLNSAKEHYVRFGFYENRLPYEIVVNEKWYVSRYVDVKDAVIRQNFASGQEHFDLVGYKEGRLPFANFSLRHSEF